MEFWSIPELITYLFNLLVEKASILSLRALNKRCWEVLSPIPLTRYLLIEEEKKWWEVHHFRWIDPDTVTIPCPAHIAQFYAITLATNDIYGLSVSYREARNGVVTYVFQETITPQTGNIHTTECLITPIPAGHREVKRITLYTYEGPFITKVREILDESTHTILL